mgnify:CR=1 FL=1
MPEKKIALQLRIDENIHKKVKEISSKELRSLNSQFEYFILKGVEEYEKENGTINFEE